MISRRQQRPVKIILKVLNLNAIKILVNPKILKGFMLI